MTTQTLSCYINKSFWGKKFVISSVLFAAKMSKILHIFIAFLLVSQGRQTIRVWALISRWVMMVMGALFQWMQSLITLTYGLLDGAGKERNLLSKVCKSDLLAQALNRLLIERL